MLREATLKDIEKYLNFSYNLSQDLTTSAFPTYLDDICYLYNIRGNDVLYNPVIISYALVGKDFANLYIDDEKIDDDLIELLKEQGVTVKAYEKVFEDLSELPGKSVLFLDPSKTNVRIYNSINSNIRISKGIQPTTLM